MNLIIRHFLEKDYEEAVLIWERCLITIGISDSKAEILKFLEKNSISCFAAEEKDALVGTVLGGFDGRRGLVHHLAVLPEYQGKGIGKALMYKLEETFKKMGVVKINFWVENRNLKVTDFYRKLGYELRDDIITMSKTFWE